MALAWLGYAEQPGSTNVPSGSTSFHFGTYNLLLDSINAHLGSTCFNLHIQIFEELNQSPQGTWTTSFLQIDSHVKDNRLRAKGWCHDGPYAEITHASGNAVKDPYYTQADKTGADVVHYNINLGQKAAAAASVRATLFYQATPPYYLMQRFQLAVPETQFNDIQRLYFLASHLNTQDDQSPIQSWRLEVASEDATIQ